MSPPRVRYEADERTQAYGRAKAQYSFIRSIFSEAKSIAVLSFDLFPKLWAISGLLVSRYFPERFSGEITQSLVFVFTWSVAEMIINLPWDYYRNFVLEAKFDFNKMTISTWIADNLKGLGLGIVIGAPVMSAVLKIIQATGQNFFYYVWLFVFGFSLIMQTIYPIVIVPIFNKLTPLEPGPLKEAVEKLAAKLKFPLSELFVIDGSKRSAHSNAYFAGLPWKKTIVIYDTLLEKSEDEEVEGVLAHELGHWKLGHTTKLLATAQAHTFYTFAAFSAFVNNRSFFNAFGFYNQQPIIIALLLFNEVLAPVDAVISLLMNILSRTYEYQADKFAFDLGYKDSLAGALIKLQKENLSSMEVDWLYSAYNYSHPILTERLNAIGYKSVERKAKIVDEDKATKASGRDEL